MVLRTLTDFHGKEYQSLWPQPQDTAETVLQAAEQVDYIAADWEAPSDFPALQRISGLGKQLLVPERWQQDFPEAGVLVSSAMSGGDLQQRFRELALGRRCWLLVEPMAMAFPLPCPDGQGTPVTELPTGDGFYSEALGCRYVHRPGQAILFDTPETLERKIQLAQKTGFQGVIADLG